MKKKLTSNERQQQSFTFKIQEYRIMRFFRSLPHSKPFELVFLPTRFRVKFSNENDSVVRAKYVGSVDFGGESCIIKTKWRFFLCLYQPTIKQLEKNIVPKWTQSESFSKYIDFDLFHTLDTSTYRRHSEWTKCGHFSTLLTNIPKFYHFSLYAKNMQK